MSKIKVWECTGCEGRKCLSFNVDGTELSHPCNGVCGARMQNWHETTAYEITERKPDYAGMAKRQQFGKFWDDGSRFPPCYGCLSGYAEKRGFINSTDACGYHHFTPCREPEEIDPYEWSKE